MPDERGWLILQRFLDVDVQRPAGFVGGDAAYGVA
jgi:hypothetical protein